MTTNPSRVPYAAPPIVFHCKAPNCDFETDSLSECAIHIMDKLTDRDDHTFRARPNAKLGDLVDIQEVDARWTHWVKCPLMTCKTVCHGDSEFDVRDQIFSHIYDIHPGE